MTGNKLKFLSMELKTKINLIKRYLAVLSLVFFPINQCHAVSVGDSYGGGTVFCVSQTPDITKCIPQGSGNYGLIMANEDQANFDSNPEHGVTWASKSDKISAARSDDDGRANTAAIIASHPKDNPGNNAAWLCRNYRDKTEGHDDWYLPAKNELTKMYLYAKGHNLIGRDCFDSKPGGIQCLIGGNGEKYRVYWSSTEHSGHFNHSCAWFRSFGGNQNYFSKVKGYFGVRAVRAFINLPTQQLSDLISKYPVAVALAVMAENPESDLESLKFIRGHADIDAAGLLAVARHRNVDVDLLRDIAGHPGSDMPILLAVAQNPLTDVAGLRAIILHRNVNSDVLTAIAAHPHADIDILLAIVQNPITNAAGLNAVLYHPNVSSRIRGIITAHQETQAPHYAESRTAAVAASPAVPCAAAAAASPVHPDTNARFTLGGVGDRLTRLGNLTQLYPPDYQPPTLGQAMTDAGVPTSEKVCAFCDDIAACAIAKDVIKCTRLTKEDAAAIAAYTFDFGDGAGNNNPYRLINKGLFERNALQLRDLRGLLYKLLCALRRLPPSPHQALYRGIRERVKLNDTHYHKGNKVTWHTFSSATIDMQTTQNFLTDQNTGRCEGTLFIIRGNPWGYDIQPFSCFPEEGEILLEPEIEFRVTGVINAPLMVVELEMLPDQRLLLESLIPRSIGAVGLGSSPAVVPVVVAPAQGKRYIAQADWQSTVAGGLSFKKGDIINVIDDIRREWWQGELNGQRGLVPPDHLKPDPSASS